MNPLDWLQGWGTELHTLWLVLAFMIRFAWKHWLKGIKQEHDEMWKQFEYEKMRDKSQAMKRPDWANLDWLEKQKSKKKKGE